MTKKRFLEYNALFFFFIPRKFGAAFMLFYSSFFLSLLLPLSSLNATHSLSRTQDYEEVVQDWGDKMGEINIGGEKKYCILSLKSFQ